MIAIQTVTARIGAVTGRGLAANLGKEMPATALYGMVGLLLIANTLNIAADIAAMSGALRLVASRGRDPGALSPLFEISESTDTGAVCLCGGGIQYPHSVERGACRDLHPAGVVGRDFMLTLVAIFGTTISPYMFFWQASLEVEERRLHANSDASAASVTRKRLPRRDAARIRFDTVTGMIYSNLIGFFIIVTSGATCMPMASRRSALPNRPPKHCGHSPGRWR